MMKVGPTATSKTLRVVTLCLALLALAPAHAVPTTKVGRITSILVQPGQPDLVFIKIDGAYAPSEQSCSVAIGVWDFAFDVTTTVGKALYSLALAAHAAGAPVTAGGTGFCTLYTYYEDLHYLHTNP
jgi:hypothetical protein